MKVTIAWTDPLPPAAQSETTLDPSDSMWVNNLDVELWQVNQAPTPNTRYYMWRLDPANPALAATRIEADQNVDIKDRNNVEQVTMPTTPANNALFRVIVRPKLFTWLTGTQRVSIIISGAKANADYRFAVTEFAEVVKGGQPRKRLTWNSIAGEYYVIQHTVNLAQGPWVNVSNVFLAKDDVTEGITNQTTDLGFYRIKTVAPGFWTVEP